MLLLLLNYLSIDFLLLHCKGVVTWWRCANGDHLIFHALYSSSDDSSQDIDESLISSASLTCATNHIGELPTSRSHFVCVVKMWVLNKMIEKLN